MAIAIRDVSENDLEAILALNNAAGPTILPLDKGQIQWFFDYANYFRVAESDGQLAGFLIGLRHDSDYNSPNFQWFRNQSLEFVYIDRIVVDSRYRGLGLGRLFYCDIQSYAEARVPLLACEVFLEPRDDVSLLFHGTFGFREVGQQTILGGARCVSLLAKELPSYAYVHDTYLNGSKHELPNLPWLAERELVTPQWKAASLLNSTNSEHSSNAASETILQ